MNYFDLHCDTATVIYDNKLSLLSPSLSCSALFADKFNKWFQCFAVFVNDNNKEPLKYYNNVISNLKTELNTLNLSNLSPVFTVENAVVLENNLSNLYKLCDDGVKMITLTWNGENALGGGVNSFSGLKEFGKDAIKIMNSLKIATDLSHLNDKSFYEAVEISRFPVATHSCFNEIFYHKRNLTLDKLKLISEKNGIVGICLYPAFLGGDNVYERFLRTVYLCLENGFENNIAIGSDFDGCDTYVKMADIPDLYRYLSINGIKEDTLDKLFFNNAFNYLKSLTK